MTNREAIKKWVEELRSGKYTQGKGALRTTGNDFCCLGVLCDIHQKETKNGKWINVQDLQSHRWPYETKTIATSFFLPKEVYEWAGFINDDPVVYLGPEYGPISSKLSSLNDKGYTFERIAEIIEMNFLNESHKCGKENNG